MSEPVPSSSATTTTELPKPPSSLESEYIKRVGDGIGVTNLTPNGKQYMAEQITTLMKRIIYDAQKFTLHGRRGKMKSCDIEAALKLMGLKAMSPLGHIFPEEPPMVHIPNPNGPDLFVPQEREIDLVKLRESSPPALSVKPYIRAHWLAYNGKVPNIPENAQQGQSEEEPEQPPPKKMNPAMLAARRETAGAATSSNSAGLAFRHAAREVTKKENVIVQQPQIESTSVEQQIYFKEIVEACVGQDDKRRQEALNSLEQDTGVQQLLPKFGSLIFDAVRVNVTQRCLSMLIYIGRIGRSLVINKSVHIEPILHQLLPSLLSCMLGKQLCLRPEVDNHWALRDFSSKTLLLILNKRGEKDTNLRQRICAVLKKVFNDPMSTYGQIYGTLNILNEVMTTQECYDLYKRYVDLTNAAHPSAVQSQSVETKNEAGRLYPVLLKMEQSMLRSYRQIADKM